MKYKPLKQAKRLQWEDGSPYKLRVDKVALDADGKLIVFDFSSKPNKTIFERWTLDQHGTLRIPAVGVIMTARG